MSSPPSAPLRIERATLDDVPALVSLINEAYDVVERGDSGTKFKSTPRLLPGDVPRFAADVLAGVVLVARGAGDAALLGVIHTTVSAPSAPGAAPHAHFGPLAVSLSAQGRGVGRALIAAAEASAAAAGASEMRIEVVDCRTDALPAYERAGYVACGVGDFPAPERCTRPVKFILMSKPLLVQGSRAPRTPWEAPTSPPPTA